MAQYIGPKEIKVIDDSTEENLVRVQYTNGDWEEMSRTLFAACVTDEPSSDLTQLRDKRLGPVAAAVLGVLRDHNITVAEWEYTNALVITSLMENLKHADAALWTKIGRPVSVAAGYVAPDLMDRSLRDIDKILKGDLQ